MGCVWAWVWARSGVRSPTHTKSCAGVLEQHAGQLLHPQTAGTYLSNQNVPTIKRRVRKTNSGSAPMVYTRRALVVKVDCGGWVVVVCDDDGRGGAPDAAWAPRDRPRDTRVHETLCPVNGWSGA